MNITDIEKALKNRLWEDDLREWAQHAGFTHAVIHKLAEEIVLRRAVSAAMEELRKATPLPKLSDDFDPIGWMERFQREGMPAALRAAAPYLEDFR